MMKQQVKKLLKKQNILLKILCKKFKDLWVKLDFIKEFSLRKNSQNTIP
jgi:hypothetical protein